MEELEKMQKIERVFQQQEQAVVYLFSRYWERLPQFKGKKILRIHTHFPDFTVEASNGDEEAIEFEYSLSDFRSHLKGQGLSRLHKEAVKMLHIVYWEENDDRQLLTEEIKQQGFKDKITYTCLKDHFKAVVYRLNPGEVLQTGWSFETEQREPPYDVSQILAAADDLEHRGAIERLNVNHGLYRTTNFNRGGAGFIEPEHWSHIHFYPTTTRFSESAVPQKLLVRPSGCEYFYGYFENKAAFKIKRGSPLLDKFFR